MYGPEAIRQICERLAREQDDLRCNELIAQLRTFVAEDREELSDRLRFLASRFLRDEASDRRTSLERGHRSGRERCQGMIIVVKADPSAWHPSQD